MSTKENAPETPPKKRVNPLSSDDLDRVRARLFVPACYALLGGIGFFVLLAAALAMFALASLLMDDPFSPIVEMLKDHPLILVGLISMSVGSAFCIYGGLQILRLRRYGVCLATAILIIIPFTSPYLPIGIIFGSSMLYALLRKDTRAAFAEAN